MRGHQTIPLLIATSLALGACSSASKLLEGVTGEDNTVLPGKRENALAPSTPRAGLKVSSDPVVMPAAVSNDSWPQPGGSASNALGNLAVGPTLHAAWSVSAGEGTGSNGRIVASPIVVGGSVYVLDAESKVSAITLSGGTAWQKSLAPEGKEADGVFGGGLASDGSRIYATTGFGEALALDRGSGAIVWRKKIGKGLRTAPTVAAGAMYFTGTENEVYALKTSDGSELWHTQGTGQSVSVISSTSPAVAKDIVVVPSTTGEVMAYQASNGLQAWSDSLTSTDPISSAANIGSIAGRPVIDGGQVFAMSNSGKLGAVSLANGEQQWSIDLSGTQTPWVAGDYVFVIANGHTLAAVSRRDGSVRWSSDLQGKSWAGPVLAGGRLIAASSDGKLASISAQTGQILTTTDLGGPFFISPVVAGGTVYLLADSGTLTALK